ncbi:MAG: hypothetical protein K2L17_12670 [Muribaculaceae bacterium]|nr:hypothetical protein [Muribaculaceae bacterium]
MMNQYPDSALTILRGIEKSYLKSKTEQARYGLLMSQALDKNYIDTTTFDILQPAIDYYLEKGTPDEKLKTLYYQGRIFMNKSELDSAMECFLKANDLKSDYTDTLTFAHMLVAQGTLYYRSLQIEDFIRNNLEASELYHKLGRENLRQSSLIKAFDACVTSDNKQRADSIMEIVDTLAKIIPESQDRLALVKLTYGIRFDPKDFLNTISDIDSLNEEIKLDIVLGYLSQKEPINARNIFESIDSTGTSVRSFKYRIIGTDVYEANGQYKKALQFFKQYELALEDEISRTYSLKTSVAEERHKQEVENILKIQHKDKIILTIICISLILLIIAGVIYFLYRLGKIKRNLAVKEQSRLQLENENLLKQNTVLELEKHAKELESEKQNLAVENMRLRISRLETENEQLKELSQQEELPSDVRKVIKERIEKMNALFAARILEKDAEATAYDDWVTQEINDKERFMDSNRLAFKASHPKFIQYLEEHGLTDYEMAYLCLYAIGLRGKDVGNYMQLRRHYNISSEIRRKLGIDEHETNIGIYIRKLLKKF